MLEINLTKMYYCVIQKCKVVCMGAGRPRKISKELIKDARAFADGGWKTENEGIAVYPTLTGLALCLGIHPDTVKEWRNNPEKSELHKEFSLIAKEVTVLRKFYLVQLGVKGELQPRICGILLSQVGVVEKKPDETKIIKVEGALPPALQEVVDSVNTESASKE